MQLEVRKYRGTDHDAVVALWRRVFADAPRRNDPVRDIQRKLDHQPELFLVAREPDELVGTAMAGYDGHRGWLHLVAVAPHARKRGIGRALLARAEQLLADLGCPKLNIQVRASAAEPVAFYERLGYRIEERISMGKELAPNRET
ncbi:MAG: GNAT family acetyltransferase [Deltaproteobacteria bacterium]|nr:GNAT family acetyltransferase [Deltaproteobacteria bacterium]MBW2360650.1 GNAT family acetyltransferase [Deltaproteobacteria bacterium]